MARAIGITGNEREDLERFDRAYLEYYPYLAGYVDDELLGLNWSSRSASASGRWAS